MFRFFGYTAEDFTSNSSFWAERVHPDDIDRVFRSLEKLSEHDYTKHEYRFKHKDGRWRWVHDDVAQSRDASGKAAQLMGARVVITGIRPEVAQMLVSLQIDLAGIVTSGTLQAGIAVAQSLARAGAAESARPA
ncbi:PAS domain-containing protein [Sorangium sp. So ce1128]